MARQNVSTFKIDDGTYNGLQISTTLMNSLLKQNYTVKNYDTSTSADILDWGTLVQKTYEAQSMYNKAINESSVLRLNMGEEIYEGGADVRKFAVQYSENGTVVLNAYQTIAVRAWGNHDMYLGFVADNVTGDCWVLWGDRQDSYNSVYAYYYENLTLATILVGSQFYTSNGGGATHIAKVTGQLKDLSSNLSDILMVSGGGGGGLLSGDTDYSGKEAGGISGSGDNSADQSTGNAFGQGESGTNVSGGGSGLYGGYKGTSSKSGGAGSGYIGNSLLSNKKMVGYNVPTSSAEGTKTESVNDVSASPVSGKPKSGNGFARIKFLRDS